jgi:hypothetical protein
VEITILKPCRLVAPGHYPVNISKSIGRRQQNPLKHGNSRIEAVKD